MSSTNSENVRIGATLRQFREMRGLKTGELANLLDISYAYLSNIEAGRKPLTDKLAAKAADVLKIRQIALVQPGLVAEPDAPTAATA